MEEEGEGEEEEGRERGREEGGWVKQNPPNTHVGPVFPASLRFSACEYAST